MKKAYTKPGFYIENFSLSQSIATDCGLIRGQEGTLGKPGLKTKESCGWDMGNLIVWTANSTCTLEIGAETPFEGVCYNAPNGGTSIFAYS